MDSSYVFNKPHQKKTAKIVDRFQSLLEPKEKRTDKYGTEIFILQVQRIGTYPIGSYEVLYTEGEWNLLKQFVLPPVVVHERKV